MKKLFLFLFFCFAFFTLTFAQENPLESKSKNKVKYYSAVELNCGTGMLSASISEYFDDISDNLGHNLKYRNCANVYTGISNIFGVDFNDRVLIGVGLSENYWHKKLGFKNVFTFNQYLTVKYNILKKYKWSPYVSLDFGYHEEIMKVGGVCHPNINPETTLAMINTSYVCGDVYANLTAGALYRMKNGKQLYMGLGMYIFGSIFDDNYYAPYILNAKIGIKL